MSGVNCREYEMALMDLARGRPVDAATHASLASHVESCGRCRRLLDSQIRLSAATSVVSANASRWNAPFRVEQAVMAEVRAVRVPRRRFVYAAAGAAIAASLVLVWAVNRSGPKLVPRPAVNAAISAPVVENVVEKEKRVISTQVVMKKKIGDKLSSAPLASLATQQPFIAIPYTMPLQPYEHANVVRVDVPVMALIAAGLPIEGADPSARVQTDVLVGQDGQARAVRPISISMVSYQMDAKSGVSQQ